MKKTLVLFTLLCATAHAASTSTPSVQNVRFPHLAMPRQTFFIRASARDFQRRIEIVSQSVQREGAVMHATGSVQVRIIHPDEEDRTVIRADEVIYHSDTGEIETHGDARITMERAR
jgi:lipopolysaccharide assembly outer membrane protein LptD (OstA)